ncbi:MFS general substrate transporter [Lindgomyces ingoldianus]|uniref:MFS general substrate transporter n=1 Tax=Lindgomyces ingoldianus TaxID=673940 RepID=A0ACB6RBC0_9PLEO|nr:MFS general substrate transporter [Lindgomyces ingoldianus]KAF2476628.1 MFS general substrate transporter [Lindgomyces ingoldianus]
MAQKATPDTGAGFASSIDSESCTTNAVEGGVEGWLTIVGSALVYYSSFGIINSFGFFQSYYKNEFLKGTSPFTIAFIGTLQIALMNLLSPVSGSLCDLHGIKYLYIGSGLGTSGTLLALSFTSPGAVWQTFLSQGLLLGFVMSFGIQSALTVAGQHFRHKRAFAMGIVSTGSSAGGICYPIMFDKLVAYIGFPWAVRIAAVKVALCYAIALCISTSRPSGRVTRISFSSLLDLRGFLDVRYSVIALGAFLCHLGIWVPFYYIQEYCGVIYPSASIQVYLLSLANATSLIGMIVGGFLGDTIGRLNLLYPIIILSGLLSLFMWLLAASLPAIIAFSCIHGYCTGHFVALLPAVVGQISPDEKLGARMGAFYSLVAIASLVGTPVGGALIKGKSREGYQNIIFYTVNGLVLIPIRRN